MILEINKGVARNFKVNGRYGEPIPQDNGFGQGDSFALLIALVYVGIQMIVARRACPLVSMFPLPRLLTTEPSGELPTTLRTPFTSYRQLTKPRATPQTQKNAPHSSLQNKLPSTSKDTKWMDNASPSWIATPSWGSPSLLRELMPGTTSPKNGRCAPR